jgi:hypothetical protein
MVVGFQTMTRAGRKNTQRVGQLGLFERIGWPDSGLSPSFPLSTLKTCQLEAAGLQERSGEARQIGPIGGNSPFCFEGLSAQTLKLEMFSTPDVLNSPLNTAPIEAEALKVLSVHQRNVVFW